MIRNSGFISQLNELSSRRIPFLFVIDFLAQNPLIFPLDSIPDHIRFSTPKFPDHTGINKLKPGEVRIRKQAVSFDEYTKKFDEVYRQIHQGNSYLVNLTQATQIVLNKSLEEVYALSRATFKLLIKDQMVVFSPEAFIRICNGQISTFPMKGTIDAAVQNATEIILNDPKETAEHYTIVDLLRNDLSRIADHVYVPRFRYIDTIHTNEKTILQVSSEIKGILPPNYHINLGDLIFELLPAGSISGAPKRRTLKIIEQVEGYERGYYTGVFGVFDGKDLESAVMIRYIEKTGSVYTFKSGGGITHLSTAEQEYQELLDKVYVPIH